MQALKASCLVAFLPLAIALTSPQLFAAKSTPLLLLSANSRDGEVPKPISIPGLMRPVPGVDYTPRPIASDMTQYAVDQLTLNRVRDCAVTNKEELLKIMRGPAMFTRSGSDQMDAIVEQLVASAPLSRPLQSALIDGSWVKQGVWSSITHVVSIKEWADGEEGPTIATFRYLLKGLIAVNRCLDVLPGPDAYTYMYSSRGARVSLFNGLVNFKLPPLTRRLKSSSSIAENDDGSSSSAATTAAPAAAAPGASSFLSASPILARILYLDSDVKIVVEGRGAVVDPDSGELESDSRPDVYIKPAEFKEQMEQRLRKRIEGRGALVEGLSALASPVATASRAASLLGRSRSPLRVRDRIVALVSDGSPRNGAWSSSDNRDSSSTSLLSWSQRTSADAASRRTNTGDSARSTSSGGGSGGGLGLVGELNWLAPSSEESWATESDLLERLKNEAASSGTASNFKVEDLMSGKLKKRYDVPSRDSKNSADDDANDELESLVQLTSYELRAMGTYELKVECAKRGLSTSGVKQDLVARLLKSLL